MGHGETGLEVLSRDESLALASRSPVGRVALVVGGAPVVVPVNFALFQGDVVFRTSSASKLLAAVVGAVVSFEVDHFEPSTRSGWSVLISGPASEIVDTDVRAAVDRLAIDSWVADSQRYVRIAARVVSGRRLDPEAGGDAGWFTDWDLGMPPG